MTLAQATPPTPAGASTSIDVLIWVGALIVAVLLLGIVILLVRKRLFAKDGEEVSSMLGELRSMHKSGELTTEEYDAARKALTLRVVNRIVPTPPGPSRSTSAASQARAPRPPQPPRQSADRDDDALRARPGFDLTGAPLPKPAQQPAPPPQPRATPPGPYDRKPPTT